MKRIVASASALLLAAAILSPIEAVSAAQPACAAGWVAWGSLELPAGYWGTGPHTYVITDEYTDIDGKVYSDRSEGSFAVTTSAPLYSGQVFITLDFSSGYPYTGQLLAYDKADPTFPVTEINPAQDTVFVLGWVAFPDWGYTRASFGGVIASLTQTVEWDGHEVAAMRIGPVAAACSDGPGFHLHTFGPNVK